MATTKKYEEAPIYSNQYENQIKDLSQGILNREPFSYDAEADPVYQQYKSQYMRNVTLSLSIVIRIPRTHAAWKMCGIAVECWSSFKGVFM